jgi:hypothetical protein
VNKIIHNSSSTGAEPLAAQWHSEFEELCVLATSGELADEEWTRLREHLQYCDICRNELGEHDYVATQIMPAIGAAMEPDSEEHESSRSLDMERGERRLMNELASEETARKKKHKWTGMAVLLVAASTAIMTSIGLSIHGFRNKNASNRIVVPPLRSVPPLPASPLVVADSELQRGLIIRYRKEVAGLERRLEQETALREHSQQETSSLTQQLQTERDAHNKLQSTQEQLNQQLVAAQAEANSLRDKVASSVSTAAELASLQQELGTLHVELDDRSQSLAENRELLSHDRDIRDLIGARNLLIAEIVDVAETGVRNKPFGRIFYTKDKSLIFYGYDLDRQPGLKRSVAFQAWGSSDNGRDVSLGLFYQDDSKKRWVLKFNDAKTLARLNSVFVTVEPQGGSTTPTGKPLLMASLRIEPNHP